MIRVGHPNEGLPPTGQYPNVHNVMNIIYYDSNKDPCNIYREASHNLPQYWRHQQTEEPEEGGEDEDDDLNRVGGDGDGEHGGRGPVGSQGAADKAVQRHGSF